MAGLASLVLLYSAKKIIAKGFNLVRQIGDKKIDLELGKDVTFVQVNETFEKTPDFKLYERMYPVQKIGKKVLLYKAVHKSENGIYFSDYKHSFTYEIGEVKTEECDESKNHSCSNGIHISHLRWVLNFGRSWKDLAILECEVATKDVIVAKDCDGKVRTSKLKVIREVPKSEW